MKAILRALAVRGAVSAGGVSCTNQLIHASFIFTELREGGRLTPQRFYGLF